jgi:hypothetical protein
MNPAAGPCEQGEACITPRKTRLGQHAVMSEAKVASLDGRPGVQGSRCQLRTEHRFSLEVPAAIAGERKLIEDVTSG